MKCLSLRQPWSWLVLHGKNIENRKWNTTFRGQFLIHASAGMTRNEYREALEFTAVANPQLVSSLPFFEDVQRGGIVGRATLVDVIAPCITKANAEQGVLALGTQCNRPWHMCEQFGFLLEDVEELPFRALKGALGFFEVQT